MKQANPAELDKERSPSSLGCLIIFGVIFCFSLFMIVGRYFPALGFEDRVIAPVKDHYAPSEIRILDSVYFNDSGQYWAGSQICMTIEVIRAADQPPERKIIMVNGDDDGGSFRFMSEYPTLQQCQNNFDPG